jgi:hypothetical protein
MFGAVDADPQLVGAQDLGEDPVDPGVLPVVPQRLVLVDLDHPTRFVRRPIPGLRIASIHFQKLPDQVDDPLEVRLGYARWDHHIAVLLEMGMVGGGKDRTRVGVRDGTAARIAHGSRISRFMAG